MNFSALNKASCIPGTGGSGTNGSGGNGGNGGGGTPVDPRCSDAAFAAANPSICASTAYIVLKPASSIISTLGSVQFNVFLYLNGVETQVFTNLLFGSSDPTIFVIGASSGNGTGLNPGQVVVTATYQGLSATASVTVVDSSIGCSQTPVATAIVVDNSKSMSQSFGGPYRTLLDFAKAAARSYAGSIVQVLGQPKDSVAIFSFNDLPSQVTSFLTDTTALTSAINGITQSQGKTNLATAIVLAVSALQATTAAEKVLLLITDGTQTDAPTEQDVLAIASAFTQAGGIIICIGCRASGSGFDLLERAATGGFFINAVASNASAALGGLSYLKTSVCAGTCVPAGDFYAPTGAFDYSSFNNWSVIAGQVNLIGNGFLDLLPGNGLYVQLAADDHAATIQTIDKFKLNPGDLYEISFSLAGNNEMLATSANPSVLVYVQDSDSNQIIFQHVVSVDWNADFQTFSFNFLAQYAANCRLCFQQQIAPGFSGNFAGNLLDNIVFKDVTTLVVLLSENFDEENIVYTPPACGPSAALPVLTDPTSLSIGFINYAGGSQISGETYKYAYSYKTQQGETNLTPVLSTATLTPVAYPNQATLIGGILPNPNTYPLDRILSIRLWRNDNSGSSTLFLLAEISPESINYVDTLDHAQFAAILDNAIIPPVANTTAVAQGALGFGVGGCYSPECEPAVAVGAQVQDPNPLPDIESGSGGGGGTTQFNSTQQYCASCPAGQIGSLTPVMTALTAPSGECSTIDGNPTAFFAFDKVFASDLNPCHGWWTPNLPNPWIQYKFPTAQIPVAYCISALGGDSCSGFSNAASSPTAWELQGSNDGTTWTTLDTQTGISFASSIIQQFPLTNSTEYQYLRVVITAVSGGTFVNVTIPILEIVFYGVTTTNQICMSATATSFASQADADAKALAAATQAVNSTLSTIGCITGYISTKSYTAQCACGQLGQPVTQSATAASIVSQADADSQALTQATALANAALVCNLSNNGQQISLPDNAANGPAAPYPSVKYVTGFVGNSTKVTIKLNSIVTSDLGNFDLLLVSPSGKTCLLKQNTPASGLHFAGNAPWTVTFDDAAGSGLPPSSLPTNNGTYKPTQSGVNSIFPGCIAANPNYPYGTTLANVAGDSPNGAWSLWVRSIDALGHVTTIAAWDLAIT